MRRYFDRHSAPPILPIRLPLLTLVALAIAGPLSAQEGESALVLGPLFSAPFTLYSGIVQIRASGEATAGQYSERVELGSGFQASFLFRAGSAGDMRLALHGYRSESEGTYMGLSPRESQERGYLSIGVDFGWRPPLWSNGRSSLRIPFGPSLSWQRLALSEGHRNKYGDPVGFTTPEVEWDDRTWVSLGGHAGLLLDIPVNGRFGFVATAMTRMMYIGNSAWERAEQEAIRRSTGRAVLLNYEDPLVFSYGFQGGVKVAF